MLLLIDYVPLLAADAHAAADAGGAAVLLLLLLQLVLLLLLITRGTDPFFICKLYAAFGLHSCICLSHVCLCSGICRTK